MKRKLVPTRETLEKHAKLVPEINVPAVMAMLQILETSSEIQHEIVDILERNYQLSEGKLLVMIILHQAETRGIAPSALADTVGVTRATISVMLRRMTRDGFIYAFSDEKDARAKKICLTEKGRNFMDAVLPDHYLRITKLMGRLSEQEQELLIRLLKKIVCD